MSEAQEAFIPVTEKPSAEKGAQSDIPPCTPEMSRKWLEEFRKTGRIPVQNTLNIRGLRKR